MKKLFLSLALTAAAVLGASGTAAAQGIELSCPPGYSILPFGQTFNNSSHLFRQWQCVSDLTGDVVHVLKFGAYTNGTAPGTPPAGYVYIYSKTDKKMYFKDDTGTETAMGGGGGGTPGGAVNSVQFNNAGSFGGFGSWNGTTFTVPGAANSMGLAGSTTTNPITMTATGSDANINISLLTKGLGTVLVNNTSVPSGSFPNLLTGTIGFGLYLEGNASTTSPDILARTGNASYNFSVATSGGGTLSAPTAVLTGSSIYNFNALGFGTTDYQFAGGIEIFSDATFTNTNHPGHISLRATPINTTLPQEFLQISSQQIIAMPVGVQFAAYNSSYPITNGTNPPPTTNFERNVHRLDGTGLISEVGSEAAGTGVLRPLRLLGSSVLLGNGPLDLGAAGRSVLTEVANEGVTGTFVNQLASQTAANPNTVKQTAAGGTESYGVVVAGAGTTGNAQIAVTGRASCVFDGATTSGNFVVISATIAGNCHDGGSVRPTSGKIIGRVQTTNGGAGTFDLELFGLGTQGAVQSPVADASLAGVVSSPISYFVCAKANGSTCASTDAGNGWNGNVTAAPTISDANDCLTVSTPCRTFQGVQTKVAGKPFKAIPKAWFADAADTVTDCYSPANQIWTGIGSAGLMPMKRGARLDDFPVAYLYLYGNPTTPANAPVSFTCGSSTRGADNAITFDGPFAVRMNGFQFRGYDRATGEVGAMYGVVIASGGAHVYGENMTSTGDPAAGNGNSEATLVAMGPGSAVAAGGTHVVSATLGWLGTSQGGIGFTYDPSDTATAFTTLSFTCATGQTCGSPLFAQEGSTIFTDRLTWTDNGPGTFVHQIADLSSHIIYVEAYTGVGDCNMAPGAGKCNNGIVAATVNATNYNFELAQEGSYVDNDCVNSTDGTCTVNVQPTIKGIAGHLSLLRDFGSSGFTTPNYTFTNSGGNSAGCVSTAGGTTEISQCGFDSITSRNSLTPYTATADTSSGQITFNVTQYDGTNSFDAPIFQLGHSYGTKASPSVTGSGAILGTFLFGGFADIDKRTAAGFRALADGTWDATHSPGKLCLQTHANTAPGGMADVWCLDAAGAFRPVVAGVGDLGTTLLPVGNAFFGTAATNNFKVQPAAAAAARTINLWDFGANGPSTQNYPGLTILTSQYTNSTTTFSNVAGGNTLQFPVLASTTYTAICHLYYQAAATGGLNIEFTGPASPTTVIYGLNDPISATAFGGDGVATAYSTSLGSVVTTASTNFDAIVSFSLINGVNAGTVNLLAKSSAAVQLQIQAGSFCKVQ